jgi:large conductance mechanosensitive channel
LDYTEIKKHKGLNDMKEKKKTKFVDEFKEFISRGSVIDLAVGVIIGGAFSKIITSLVADIITPIISIFTGQSNFDTWIITVGGAEIKYGVFIQTAIDFVLIAFFVFLFIKGINVLRRKQLEEAAAKKEAEANKISKEVELLTEIRNLLKQQQK